MQHLNLSYCHALEFLNKVREDFQVVILSDTFHEIAKPLMDKLGHPLLLCHTLEIDNDDNISSYQLRHVTAKKQAILGFQQMGYRCFAAGDSFNDIQMFELQKKVFSLMHLTKLHNQCLRFHLLIIMMTYIMHL